MGKGQELKKDDIQFVQMEITQLPTFSVNRSQGIINWGKKNDWPATAISLLENHPIHGGIIKGKARYLSGLSIKPEQDLPIVKDFLEHANPKESWYDLSLKCNPDKVLYGGFAMIEITNLAGQPMEYYHADMGKLRMSDCYTGLWYSDEWDLNRTNIQKTFYPFKLDGFAGSSITVYKAHHPAVSKIGDCYPKPEYIQAVLDIATDIEISKFFNSLAKNNFSPGHIITFFSGEIKDEVKADIKRRFLEQNTGPEGNKVVLAFAAKDGKGADIQTIDSSNHDKIYHEINTRNKQNIVAGHQVPGELFKIEKEGSAIFDRNSVDFLQEIFINEYAKPEQKVFLDIVKKACKARTQVDMNFTIEQFDLIGSSSSDVPPAARAINNAINKLSPLVATKVLESMGEDEIRALVGLQSKTAPVLDANGVPVQESKVNEHLKNITGRQRQNLKSIVDKYNKGLKGEPGGYTKAQAALLLKSGFGLNDSEVEDWLTITDDQISMSAVDNRDAYLSWVRMNTVEFDEADEVVNVSYMSSRDEFLAYESSKALHVKFEETKEPKSILDRLIDAVKTGGKKKADDTEEYDYEIYTLYKYVLRPDLKGEAMLLPTSHQFCKDMVEETSGKKRLTFEAIDALDNDFGQNAFDYRGGFTGKRHTCRHIWAGESRTKKIKKSK